jgi:hypothetical protein
VEELARLLLLLAVIAIVINLVQGGPESVSAWFRAKFLGRSAVAE